MEFPVLQEWDRGPAQKGTVFSVFAGEIEVLGLPPGQEYVQLQGFEIAIEVKDVEDTYRFVTGKGIELHGDIANKPWGHRAFSVKDPDAFASNKLKKIATHEICGRYPSDHPGVLVYNTKKKASENRTWFIHGEDLLLVADFLKTGKYPTKRIFARSSRPGADSCYIDSRIGVRISDICGNVEDNTQRRYISGGVLTGYEVSADSFMGIYETSLTVFPKSDVNELFGFIRPGTKKPSYSRTFLSFFSRRALDMDACIHGEVRACINCGTCSTVCQVDILPQFTYKAVLADDIEEAVEHGLLDCVECGLCTYVCPSKIELYETLKLAKYAYYNEQT